MVFDVETKKWGNSVGVIIPSKALSELNIRPGEKISIEIKHRKNVLQELFGALKFKGSTEKTIRGVRKDLDSKWLE